MSLEDLSSSEPAVGRSQVHGGRRLGTEKANPDVVFVGEVRGPHVVAKDRHSSYVCRLLSMCQMNVVSFRITATRAIDAPRRRLIRLYHSRSRGSFRKAW